MKKFVALLLALVMVLSLVTTVSAEKKIKIGISIWSSTDTLGSECKRIIDAAAKALDVDTQWVDQAHISEQVTASAETLCLADCDGIIISTPPPRRWALSSRPAKRTKSMWPSSSA